MTPSTAGRLTPNSGLALEKLRFSCELEGGQTKESKQNGREGYKNVLDGQCYRAVACALLENKGVLALTPRDKDKTSEKSSE